MKKFLLPALVFFTTVLLLGGCQSQPTSHANDGMSAPRSQERHARRPVARKPPDGNRAGKNGSADGADFLNDEEISASENQDYIDVPENQPIRSATLKQEEVLPSMTYVNERLAEYGKKLDRWRELDRESSATAVSPEESAELISCFQQLQKVMNGYSTLRANMLDSMNAAAAKTVSVGTARDLYKTDIDFLESRCGLMLTDKPPAPKVADGPLQATEDTLLRNYAAGNYDSVTQLWRALPADQGARLRVSAQNAAAQAMLRQGDEKGAAAIYKKLLQRLDDEDSPDRLDLRRNLADISFATGDTGEAMRQYRLIDSDYRRLGGTQNWAQKQAAMITAGGRDPQGEYADILHRWLLYMPERDGFTVGVLADKFLQKYPNSPVADSVGYIRDDTRGKAENWINGRASAADKLEARRKFQEAARMSDAGPANVGEGEPRAMPKGKNERTGQAAAGGGETTRPQQGQDAQRQWDIGMQLAQKGRYDDAIDVFNGLENSDLADKAKAKVREISLQAAQDERSKAAKLYDRYTKTADVEMKKTLLLKSRRILKDILVRYPDTEITAKVAANIERVEQEIRSIAPNLLPYADQPGQEPPPYDQPQ